MEGGDYFLADNKKRSDDGLFFLFLFSRSLSFLRRANPVMGHLFFPFVL